MYTAVRMVKMNAWRAETNISNPVSRSERGERQHCRQVAGSPQGGRQHREGDQQQVAGHHVGPEPDSQRERSDQDDLKQLDGSHQDVEELGHSRREQRPLEVVPEALGLDAHIVIDSPHHQRQGDGHRHTSVGRELDEPG